MMREGFDGKRTPRLSFAGFVLLVLLVGALAVSCGGTTAEQGAEPQASADLDHPSLGNANAPVVLTEYADFQ
jgi:protein-disulfide isomerase